jgi:hypothetical protein
MLTVVIFDHHVSLGETEGVVVHAGVEELSLHSLWAEVRAQIVYTIRLPP